MSESFKLWSALCALGAIYACVAVGGISVAYLDFGDGNYLYISARLADGLLLYRDILAPQPPLHLLTGMILIRVARLFSAEPEVWLYFVRIFSLLLHLATMALLALLSRRLFRSTAIAILAALFYLIIPIGFWWTLCYQSEPLMLLFLLGGFYCMLRWDARGMIAGGALHLLAVLTNMTAAPYICWNALLLLVFDRKKFLAYVLPCGCGWLLAVGLFYLAGADYLGNVFLNQVGTFPKAEILAQNPDGPQTLAAYVIWKLKREGFKILKLDFFYLLWGVAGLLLYLARGLRGENFLVAPDGERAEPDVRRGRACVIFVATFAFWTWMSLGFVSKGATEDYIFTIGEPLLCVFAAAAIVWFYQACQRRLERAGSSQLICFVFPAIFLVSVYLQTFGLQFRTSNLIVNVPGGQLLLLRVLSEELHELPAREVRTVARIIEQYSRPGDLLLGPPHYAFITRRVLAEEYSEIFIWRIKYLNEKIVERRDGEGVAKVRRLAAALREKKIAVALMDNQLLGIPELRAEVLHGYRQVHQLTSLNTPLSIFVPREDGRM